MPDIAGAKAAIKARLDANWATTRITYGNAQPADPWPPVDGSGVLVPWVNLEIRSLDSEIAGTGTPGNHVWKYYGLILVHVFVPVGSGTELADQYAATIGEIFRAKEFYNSTPGYAIRSLSPNNDDGDSASDDGNWFRVTMTCPFTYWHRG